MSALLVLPLGLPAVGPCGGNPGCVVQPFDDGTSSGVPLGLLAMAVLVVLLGVALVRAQRRDAREDLDEDGWEDDADAPD